MWSKPFEALKLCVVGLALGTWAFSAASSFQTTAKIDFGRDVLPIFRQNCFGCHGPSQQINGLRLDRRSSVFKNGARRVVPGSSENSFLQSLLDRGADFKNDGALALVIAVMVNCSKCMDLIAAKNLDRAAYTIALLQTASLGDLRATRLMLDHGADVNAVDPLGHTALMYAATSDLLPLDVVKLLIERGANVNARSQHAQSADAGQTALDIAMLHGSYK